MPDYGLRGRVALVTGANLGIGAATALALAREGADVFLASFGPPNPVAALLAVRNEGVRAAGTQADLADPTVPALLFQQAEEALGPVSILVNNAAAGSSIGMDVLDPRREGTPDWNGRPISVVTAESHDDHFAVNSRAVALLIAEFARRHRARGATWGRIVSVSTDGADGFAGEVSYGASKAALESYTRAAAKELAPLGITANIASLGAIDTGWYRPEMEAEIVRAIPLGRVGRPEDAADAIAFLCSEQARWLTGQTLFVGGGHRMV